MKLWRVVAIAVGITLAFGWVLRPSASRTSAAEVVAHQMRETKSLEEQITALERKELDAIKDGNMTAFAGLLADDAVFVNSRGFGDKALVVKNTSAFKLIEYSMDEVKIVPLSANAGLIAYKLTEKGNAHGKEISGVVYASAVWAEREGKWVCLFSQETPARQ